MVRVLIDLNKFTCRWLKSISVVPGEAYESILSRLLDCKLGCNVCEYRIVNANNDCFVNLLVDWDCEEENLQFSLSDDYSNAFPSNPHMDYETWIHFKERVFSINDIFGILAVLEQGESTIFDDLIFIRIA